MSIKVGTYLSKIRSTRSVILHDLSKDSRFSKDAINKALESDHIQEFIARNSWYGELIEIGDAPPSPHSIDMNKVAFQIVSYVWVDDILYGIISPCDTTDSGRLFTNVINKVQFKLNGYCIDGTLVIFNFNAY